MEPDVLCVEPEDIIQCVAFFYAKGKSNEEHLKNEKFRARLPRKTKKIQEIKEIVRLVKV